MPSNASEFQRLIDLYRSFGDAELLKLISQPEDLTEEAQLVLRSEIASRRLETSPAKGDEGEQQNSEQFGRFALLSSSDCVWEFPETEDAKAAGAMLVEAGIEYDLILPRYEKFDMGAPRLAVLPADAARARQILSKPIPDEFRQFVRIQDQFVLPRCPKCQSQDPLVESFEPTNSWRCEACGHTWVETVPGSGFV